MKLKYTLIDYLFRNRTKIARAFYHVMFYWLPVKKNKIVFQAHLGAGYGCNPKYITEEIIRQNLDYELVWLVRTEVFDTSNFPKQVRIVDYNNVFRSLLELATSRMWISNIRFNKFFKKGLIKKRNQIYINTWHGSLGIKKLDWMLKY